MPTSITFDTIIYCENDLPFNWFGQILTSSTNTSVTLQDQYGCDSVVKLYFQVLPIQYSSFSATICSNDPAFQWAGQSYNQTGSYNQTFTAQNGCDSVVTFNLLVNPSPNVDFSVVNWSGCLPAEISFVNNQVAPNTTYLWDFGNGKVGSGSNGESSLYTQAGCFDVQLTATNEFGCVATQNQQNAVCFDPNPVASFSPQNNPLPLVNPVTLLDNTSTSANTWLWDFGDGNQNTSLFSPLHTFPEKAGIYYVTLYIENENGCKDSTVKNIIVEQDPLFYVPNSFTPDNNEFNEVFLPVFSDNLVLSDFELRITNRWGELLFVSQNPTVGWNGTYGGKLVQDGVYVYNLVFREVGFASVFQSTGSVNLIR
jgi:gliding motility-associated-like protein